MRSLYTLFPVLCTLMSTAQAQIAQNYSVGTWYQFKTAAVTYTFDDNCSNQIPVAIPLFDNYGFKVTIFAVTTSGAGFAPNWNSLKTVSTNGHEVASHTVTHRSLNGLSVTDQDAELKNSQSTIIANVPTTKCQTVAYPNCNIGDVPTIQKYYIAGRTCSGQIMSSTPSNFYDLSSNITGNTGTLTTAQSLNDKVSSAKNSKGWCVFLTHGIIDSKGNSDGGYSPTQSSIISSHLSYMNTNIADYWIGTFVNVVKYIKERNAASITETKITNDSLQATVTHNLDKTMYNVAITVRRTMPSGWKNPKVYSGGKVITSSIVSSGGTSYIQFDVVPNQGAVFLSNPKTVVTDIEEEPASTLAGIAAEPNPFWQETVIKAAGDFRYSISSMDGKLVESGTGTSQKSVGNDLPLGVYILSIQSGSESRTLKIIKN